jgi:hypothetical protein
MTRFEVGQLVYKHTGGYGGRGIVRGVTVLPSRQVRYLVGHKIEGGFGEFLHVYAEGNLREVAATEMTDEEVEAAARSDPDNPPLTDEELALLKFKLP